MQRQGDPHHRLRSRSEPDPLGRRAVAGRIGRILAWTVLQLGAAVALGLLLRSAGQGESSIVLVFVVAVAAIAFWAGRWASVFGSLVAVLAFNFFFTNPLHTLVVAEPRSVFTFFILLATGVTISELVARLRFQAARAESQARFSDALYRISLDLSSTSGVDAVARTTTSAVARWTGLPSAVLSVAPGTDPPRLSVLTGDPEILALDDLAARFAHAARIAPFEPVRANVAGIGFHAFPLPSSGERRLGLLIVSSGPGPLPEREATLCAAIAAQLALAIERELHSSAAQRNAVEAEAERLRGNLLSTVSHDLRTPLSAISGTASMLLRGWAEVPEDERRELLEEILAEAERMSRLVENLLQLARMEDGKVRVRKQWYPVEELVGAALLRLARRHETCRVRVEGADEAPLLPVDGELMTNVLENLLENALRYAPDGEIEVRVRALGNHVEFQVLDRGPGLPAGDPDRLFERYFRGDAGPGRVRGSGLGLAICRAVVRAHGGWIRAEARPAGGAALCFSLPLDGEEPPVVPACARAIHDHA